MEVFAGILIGGTYCDVFSNELEINLYCVVFFFVTECIYCNFRCGLLTSWAETIESLLWNCGGNVNDISFICVLQIRNIFIAFT